jgi:hypothetical protein
VDCWRWRETVVRSGAVELTVLGVSLPLDAFYVDTDVPLAGDPSIRIVLSDPLA